MARLLEESRPPVTTRHRPITTIVAGNNETARVHFHCPCGTNRVELIADTRNHATDRYTAALRRLHTRDAWPPPVPDTDDDA